MTELSEDSLLGGKVRFFQPVDGYRAAIDPVLLAASVEAKTGDKVLDLGCGAGAATFCLMARVSGLKVTGIELQPFFVSISLRNAEANALADDFQVFEGDFMTLNDNVLDKSFNHVIANPPYLEQNKGNIPPNHSKALAHVEEKGTLANWINFAIQKTKHKGSVTFIQRADRLDETLAQMNGSLGELVVFPLWPGPIDKGGAKGAKRVIVRGRKGVSTPLRLAPGLILHREAGGYSQQAEDILRRARPLHL